MTLRPLTALLLCGLAFLQPVPVLGQVDLTRGYCFLATFDNGMQNIYLNGALMQSTPTSITTLNQCPNASIRLGQWWPGDPQAFQGKIDEVRIYDRALAQDEISALSTCDLSLDFSFSQNPCSPNDMRFSEVVQPGYTYTWNIDGTDYPPVDAADAGLLHTFPSPGNFPITLKASNGACSGSITKTIAVKNEPSDIINTGDTAICIGGSAVLRTQAPLDFCWQPVNWLSDPSSPDPVAKPHVTTTYHFTGRIPGNNLVVNGDFSNGNTGFLSDYRYTAFGNASSTYYIGTNPAAWNANMSACSGHGGTGNMMMVNGAQQLNARIWSETIAIQPNSNYAFSAWLEGLNNVSPAILQFYINGQPVGPLLQASLNPCIWRQFYTAWNSGANTSAVISIINMNQQPSGNDFALDDISFSPVAFLTDSVTVIVESAAVKAGPDTLVCRNSPVQLRAQGIGAFSWTPAASLSNPAIANPIAITNVPTQYIVTASSPHGCTAKDSVQITMFPFPSVHITPDTLICAGDPVRLYCNGGSSYSWSPAYPLDDPSSPAPMAHPDQRTVFQVSITDSYQCITRDSVIVGFRPAPTFTRPMSLSLCEGYTGILGGNDNMRYVYSWQPAAFLNDPSSPRPSVKPAHSQQYTVTVADSVCPRYDSSFAVGVRVIPTPNIQAEKAHDINCAEPTTELNATGADFYTWEPITGLTDPATDHPTVSIDTTITYTVKGTDGFGCFAYGTVTVNVHAVGKNSFVAPNAFTPNGDGHNDCFGIQRWGDVQLEDLVIFNRQGIEMFRTRDPSACWDGNYHGQPQPPDTYIYLIHAKTICGIITRRGTVMLIR